MGHKSFQDLIESLERKNYKFYFFVAESNGNYFPEDSDWNYRDIPHSKFIHKNLTSVKAYSSKDTYGGINVVKLPFVHLSIPLMAISYEQSKFNQMYFSTIGPYILLVNTVSKKIKENETNVKTSYALGSKGVFNYFHKFLSKLILKNYKKLMSEDVPMRLRRGELRKHGHKFYSDINVSYKFTEEINRANVYLKTNSVKETNIQKSDIDSSKDGDVLGERFGLLSFFISEKDNVKKLWPTTCVHEGANLSKKCIKGEKIFCPWHNRIIKPLLIYKKKEKQKFNIIQNLDYFIREEKENFIITFRNNPEFYNK